MRTRQRVLSLLLALALALTALPGAALAAEAEEAEDLPPSGEALAASQPEAAGEPEALAASGGYCGENGGSNVRWSLDSGGTLIISGSGNMKDFGPPAGSSGAIETPPWRDDCVTVVIEEGVASVGSFAFFNCPKLKRADIAGSVKSVGSKAFYLNSLLESVDFGEGVTAIGEQAFCECRELQAVRLPDSLTSIESGAFWNCASLTEVVIPRNVTSVGANTFTGCESLTKVTAPEGLALPDLPAGVETETYTGPTPGGGETGGVEPQTWNCGGSNTAPDASVTAFLDSAGTLTVSGSGPMCDYKNVYLQTAPWANHAGIKRVVVTEGVTRVGDLAFQALPSLESAEIAGSVQTIGQNAFSQCPKLAQVTVLPGDGCEIGSYAFRSCPALKEVTLGEGVAVVGYSAFDSCFLLETVRLPSTLVRIEDYAFSGANLRTLELPENLTSIGNLAFTNCEKLEAVRFPDSLSAIGNSAFRGCTALEEVILPKNLTDLGTTAFYGSGVRRAAVPQGLEVPFQTLPDGAEVRTYTGETPADFSSIPGGGTGGGDGGGDIPPEGGTVVQSGPCGKNGENLTYQLYDNGRLTVSGTGEMADYSMQSASPWRQWAGLYPYPAVVVESGVESVGAYAFYAYSARQFVESVRLPDSVASIGASAFAGNSKLNRLAMPGVTEIGASAFASCSALTEIQVPASIAVIGDYAFSGSGLQGELAFPESLKRVGKEAFAGTGLTHARVYYQTEVPADAFPAGCRVERYGAPALTPGDPLPVSGRAAPVGSDNIHNHSYSAWSQVVCSYLASGSQGGFRRVDCYTRRDPGSGQYVGTLVMEEYDKDGTFLRSWDIPWELSYFGGFYEGSDGYYFVFANSNSGASDAVETVRVVKYTKDLEPLGKASLMGGNVAVPFYMGSLRMDEGDGTLYVYMGRQMYDGHQSSLVLAVDTATMGLLYEGTDMFHPFYVSHSMNQFIKYDQSTGHVAAASQGDTYPRALTLMRASGTLGEELGETRFLIPGGKGGNNHTLTTLGGLEVADSNYLTAYSSIDQSVFDIIRTYNVSLSVISKTDADSFRNVPVTSYAEGGPVSASNPFLVKVSENRFALLWEEQKRKETVSSTSPAYSIDITTGQVCFAYYDGQGNKLSGVHRMDGALSDCQPIVVNGSILWYVTEDDTAPVFYRITGETGGVLKSYAGTTPGGGTEEPPASEIAASGSCGKTGSSVAWTLYKDGTLVIEGTGEIKDCTSSSGVTGESTAKTACKKLVIKEGVTGIGKYAFNGYGSLESAELPDSLKAIGDSAFQACAALTEITLPQSVQTLGTQPFGNSGLTRARVYYTLKYAADAFPASCAVTLYGKTLTPSAPLAATRTAPVKTDNIHDQNYNGRYNRPSQSHLCAGTGGGFYRVEYSQDSGLVMEEYGPGGVFYQGWSIPMELPLFGGFHSGSDGFYFVFGQNNPSHSDSVEVLRAVKYTKNLERLGDAKVMGGNTAVPFDAGSCRMDEGNGLLYIHASHEMYDGHQSCMVFTLDTNVMEFQYQFYGVANPAYNGYVSHSFNQFIRADGTNVVRLDHGDGAPRGAGLFVNGPSLAGTPQYAIIYKWSGGFGENVTGAGVGGLEVSPTAYLSALSSVDQTSGSRNNNKTYNVYLLATDKQTGKTTQVQLTHYSEGGAYSASTPQLVKLSDSRFLLLWEEQARRDSSGRYYYSDYTGQVKYAFFDGDGTQIGGIRTMSGALSDCQPIAAGGKALWYVTERRWSAEDRAYVNTAPTFYQIDSAGSAGSFTPTIGKKPTGVALPDSVLAELGNCASVVAASYSPQGQLTGAAKGVLKDGSAEFGRSIPASWTLYFLDRNGAPVRAPYKR